VSPEHPSVAELLQDASPESLAGLERLTARLAEPLLPASRRSPRPVEPSPPPCCSYRDCRRPSVAELSFGRRYHGRVPSVTYCGRHAAFVRRLFRVIRERAVPVPDPAPPNARARVRAERDPGTVPTLELSRDAASEV